MPFPRLAVLPILAVIATCLASSPTPAAASTVSMRFVENVQSGAHQEERTDVYALTYTADPGEPNRLELSGGYGSVRIADPGAVVRPGPFCRPDGDAVVCQGTAGGSISMSVDLGDGDDTLTAPTVKTVTAGPGDDRITLTEPAALVDGGPGADRIEAALRYGSVTVTYADRTAPLEVTVDDGVANDGEVSEGDELRGPISVTGGAGDDTLVARQEGALGTTGGGLIGGPGNDRLTGGGGNDFLTGDDGDDVLDGRGGADSLNGGAGSDVMSGGPSFDTLWYGDRKAAVSVTLDGRRDDGEAGENDDAGADVEAVTTGSGDDTLVGNDADNSLDGGAGTDRYIGGAGDDGFFNVGAGEVADGGAGADRFLAIGGSIVIGGPGPDRFVTAAGDVRVYARDGEADTVICGSGPLPSLQTDAVDVLEGCLPKLMFFTPVRKLRPDRTGVVRVMPTVLTGRDQARPWKGTVTLRRAVDGAVWARERVRLTGGGGPQAVLLPVTPKALRTLRARGPAAVTIEATPTSNAITTQASTTTSSVLTPPKTRPTRR